MSAELSPQQRADFNAALVGMLVRRLGSPVRIPTEEFDAFLAEDVSLDVVGSDTEILLTLSARDPEDA